MTVNWQRVRELYLGNDTTSTLLAAAIHALQYELHYDVSWYLRDAINACMAHDVDIYPGIYALQQRVDELRAEEGEEDQP